MLKTKSILAPKEMGDGHRISVMNRHTLSDGTTPDARITQDLFDEHLPEVAPSAKLLGDYYKRNLPWEEYEKRYRAELAESGTQELVKSLAERSLDEDITLLCIEDTPEYCHRRLLAEVCKEVEPLLELRIK